MNARKLSLLLVVLATVVLGLSVPRPEGALARPRREPEKASAGGKCRPQRAQRFLVRSSFVADGHLLPDGLSRAIRYRTDEYGYVEGFGTPGRRTHAPSYYAATATFAGHKVRVHERIVPALECVEEELRRSCAKTPYEPASVGGFRERNTYRGGEVTNHLYGIAVDIDPEKNPCCHCVEPWGGHPRCRIEARSPYERMAMPECWVHAFERHGFYWLGHDTLEDTMHFEFLGKPERIRH